MTLLAKASGAGEDFAPPPEGMHPARCYRIVDLGTQHNQTYDIHRPKIMITLELYGPGLLMEDGRPMSLSMWNTLSLDPKANLLRDLESWRGKRFTAEELDGFDIKKLLGAPALVNVVHTEKDGKTYANIASINPLPAAMKAEIPNKSINPLVSFDLDNFDGHTFEELPEGLRRIIEKSPEYAALQRGTEAPANFETVDEDIPF